MASYSNSERMSSEPIFPLLFKLAVPSMIGMASQAIYNVVDSIFVGRISTEALSAVTLAFPIQMILIAIAIGTSVGVASLISRSLGSGDRKTAGAAAENTILAGLVLSVLIGLLGFFYSDSITRIFTSDPMMIDMTGRYVRIIMIGSVALFIPQVLQGILQGEGNTFIPMVVMLVSAVLNIGLDPLLIFGIGFFPELGIEGAAYATVLARFVSGIVLVYIMTRRSKKDVDVNLQTFRVQPRILGEIYKVGFPAMAMQLLGSITLAVANLILAQYSIVAIAVYGIYFRLQSFVFMPVFGLGQGVLPITGYNYGNKNLQRIKQTVWYAMLSSLLFTVIGFVVFQFFPSQLITLFNDSPELLGIGTTAMKRISLGVVFVGPTIISANIFQALGRGVPSLIVSVMRNVVVLLPAMYLLGEFAGLNAVWFAFPIAEIVTCTVSVVWLLSLMRTVTDEIEAPEPALLSRSLQTT